MPCRDYESDNGYEMREHYKEQCDKLARIACKAMTELTKSGRGDFLILKDDEVREWWEAHQEADRKEKARLAEIERKERVKREALARLSDEEKELLGLSKSKKKQDSVEVDYTKHMVDMLDILKSEYAKSDWGVELGDEDYSSWKNKSRTR